jgi:hypothetical protein
MMRAIKQLQAWAKTLSGPGVRIDSTVATVATDSIDASDPAINELTELTASLRITKTESPTLTRLKTTLNPYTRNNNTGNIYEISVGLQLLRKMGLTDAELDADAPFLESIAVHNWKDSSKIREVIADVRKSPAGTGLTFDGKVITAIECVTQDDSVGTGDLLLKTGNGQSLSLSICQGKPMKNGTIKKCLTNPTAKRFGCTSEDMALFSEIQAKAVEAYKVEMGGKYGAEEGKWPSRQITKASTDACSEIATITETRFKSLDVSRQKEILKDLLRIEDGKKPADYLVLVDTKRLYFYQFGTCNAEWTPAIVADGIWLHVMNGSKKIGSTQVKPNNGVYHKGKTSSFTSSWNSTFFLSDLFTMTPIPV